MSFSGRNLLSVTKTHTLGSQIEEKSSALEDMRANIKYYSLTKSSLGNSYVKITIQSLSVSFAHSQMPPVPSIAAQPHEGETYVCNRINSFHRSETCLTVGTMDPCVQCFFAPSHLGHGFPGQGFRRSVRGSSSISETEPGFGSDHVCLFPVTAQKTPTFAFTVSLSSSATTSSTVYCFLHVGDYGFQALPTGLMSGSQGLS